MVVLPTGNRKLLNYCKKYCVPQSVGHFKKFSRHSYFRRDGWEIPKDILEKAQQELKERSEKTNKKETNRPKIFQLITILRRLFTANQNAKNCIKKSTRSNAYSRKNRILYEAITLAKQISLPWFHWGIGLDDDTPGYEIVVYFQIGDDPYYQVSFHTDSTSPCPEFEGEWNGINATKFPLSVPIVRKIAKELGWTPKQLIEQDSSNIPDTRPLIEYNDIVSAKRSMRYEAHRYSRENHYGRWNYDFDDDDDGCADEEEWIF